MGCGNHNYADKVVCNRCGAPNTNAGHGGGKSGKREGDWECRACGNLNYASRDVYNKCGVARTVFISKSGMRPGDWICPNCGNHNWADKNSCVKCGTPKDESYVKQPVVK